MSPQEAEALSEAELAKVLGDAVKAKQPGLAEALAKSGNKSVARAAKRALYQLKSSGVAVAVEATKGEQPNLSREVEELPALMSAIAGTGERALFFVKQRPQGGGLDTFQAIVHDELGILQLDRGDAQRSKFKRHLEQVRREQPSVIEAPIARALEELGVAWAVSARSKNPLPPDADSHLRRLGVVAIEAWPDLPAIEAGDAALVARAASLHEERVLAAWLPGEQQIRLLSARLDEVDASPLQLTEPQKHEQRLQKVALTAGELTVDQRRIYAQRLWRTAQLLEKTSRPEQGKIARAEARLLFHEPKAKSLFVEKMFEKVVMLAERARAQQLAQQQGQPEQPPPTEKQSPGGLIIP